MMEILLVVLLGFGGFCGMLWYVKCREEAKRDGVVSDEYIENNEEEDDE